MQDFLRREHVFLRRPLNLGSRLLVLLAAGALAAAAWLPLWEIRLVAPQYREGLSLRIHSHRLEGGHGGQDLHEINLLNHYIGMKPLAQADFTEMRWMPFALGGFVLLALRTALLGRMIGLIDVLVLFFYFTAFSVGNFQHRLHTYGHQLDPHAPMTIEPFTPILLGTQRIANFTQTSLPLAGGYCLAVVLPLLGWAIWHSRREEP